MPELVVTDGLPDGWTFHTVEHGKYVTYEVRNEHRFLIMSSTWNRDWLGVADIIDEERHA